MIKDILFFRYKKDLLNDIQSALKTNFEKFENQNEECSTNLFDYLLFCIFFLKTKKNIRLNNQIIILNEDYLNNSEEIILHKNELFLNKLIIIPHFNNSENKWELILLKNIFKEEENQINIKIFSSNKFFENIEAIVKDIIYKLTKKIIKEDLIEKAEKLIINKGYNSSRILLNLINDLSEENNLEEFFIKSINDENNKDNYFKELNNKNEIFEIIEKDYPHLLKEYLKFINLINEDSKKERLCENIENIGLNNEISKKELMNLNDEKISKHSKLIKEEENKSKTIKGIENNKKEEHIKLYDKYEEMAKKMTNDIMNLNFFPIYVSKENNQRKTDIKLSQEHKNNIHNKFNDIKLNKNEKNKDKLDNNISELHENETLCGNKKLDETTKNTINDILEFVLNEMKSNRRVVKRKYSQRNKRAVINEQKQIEIIEEEDKESSTSEMCKEKRICEIRDSISSLKDEISIKEELRESFKNFRLSGSNKKDENIKKLIKKNCNENEKEINNINKIKKNINNEKKSTNIKINDKDIKPQIDNIEKKQIKKEIKENKKENVIQIKIDDNNPKLKENSDNFDKSSSNNDNITISNSNSIIDNNSLDIENFEVEYTKAKKEEEKKKDKKNEIVNIHQKDNKKQEIKKPFKQTMNKGNIVFNNIVNKYNKININTINAQNIIIINNNIINSPKKHKIKKEEYKLHLIKEPEDAKIPKDNKTKKRNLDTNIKKKSEEQSINSINLDLLIKEAFSNTKSKKDNKNIESYRYVNQNNDINLQNNSERSLSDAEKYNLIISNKKGKNYVKLPNDSFYRENNKNKNKKISNIEKNSDKLIGNINNSNESKNNDIIKSKTNIKNNFKKRIVKSKTHDFDKEKYKGKKELDDKKDEFFNISNDCILF